MEVAVYLRKSREEENETREETLARHERMLKDYCDSKNLIIKKIYKEVVSGENIANRPQMQRLLEDVQDKLYDGVVVIEIERLSRGNQIDQAEILEIFKKSKTKIYTLNKIYDLSSDDDKKAIKTIPILENVLKEYWNLSNKERNDLLKTFIEKIEYTKTKRSPSRGSIESKIKNINLKIYLKI